MRGWLRAGWGCAVARAGLKLGMKTSGAGAMRVVGQGRTAGNLNTKSKSDLEEEQFCAVR
jgi:hypothetical protein